MINTLKRSSTVIECGIRRERRSKGERDRGRYGWREERVVWEKEQGESGLLSLSYCLTNQLNVSKRYG